VLVRPEGDGALLITQQAHAWVSGQLARAWGNDRVDPPHPREQVCLAAEQHDLGMASADMAPDLDPETGFPQSFMDMPLERHLAIWRLAPRRMLAQDRYAAILVSMHGSALYELRERTPGAERYLAEQSAFQRELAATLGVPDEELRRNQKLIWIFDSLSLAVLLGWDPLEVEGFTRRGATVEPWPFREDSLRLGCDARRLTRGDPLEAARWETVEIELSAGG
jgi:Protein of unknown function (DUF3891)